ncbi:MAG: hypothetical protein U0263_20120 [Polyangiaceae bacterium]
MRWLFLILFASWVTACSSDDAGGGSSSTGGASTGGASTGGASTGGASTGGASTGGASTGGAAGSGGVAGTTGATCASLGAPTCFSNYDCTNASDRCHNLGTEADPDVCCVAGARGTHVAGEPCSSDIDCKSSICIDLLCSDICKSPDDCPLGMKDCTPIAFSGSTDSWCLPTK